MIVALSLTAIVRKACKPASNFHVTYTQRLSRYAPQTSAPHGPIESRKLAVDGYAAGGATTDAYRDLPSRYVADSTDCDDTSALYHPGTTESDCTDPNDYNCDGSVGYAVAGNG